MIDVEWPKERRSYPNGESYLRPKPVEEIGLWLEENMPNPPLPEQQRWTLGYDADQERFGLQFFNDYDATIFSLRWA